MEHPKTQKQWKEYLQNLVRTDEKALVRAIVVIGGYQTAEELALAETNYHNEMGFGSVDAPFFTPLYFKCLRGEALTPKELAIARNKMPKYWKQLMKVAKSRPKRPPSPYVVGPGGQLAIREIVM